MSRTDPAWQRIVRDASARGRIAESIGLSWDSVGWTLEERRYLSRLSAWDRRQLEQEIIDAIDDPAPLLADGLTALAAETIPTLDKHWLSQTRPSKRRTADLAGINRDTLSDWIKRGWWSPPAL